MRHLDDDELAWLMRPRLGSLQALTVKPAATPEEKKAVGQEKPLKAATARPEQKNAPRGRNDSREEEASTGDERDYLQSIIEKPNLTTTQRRDYLGLSTYKNDQVKKAVLARGLAEELAINLGHATRGNVKFLELTEKGWRALGHKPGASRPHNCSAEHWWYQRRIVGWYQSNGLKAEAEMSLGSTRADVGVIKGERRLAIEVAITPKNEAVNAKKDLEAGFNAVLIACKNANVKSAVEERLRLALTEKERSRVKVMLLSDTSFLKESGTAS